MTTRTVTAQIAKPAAAAISLAVASAFLIAPTAHAADGAATQKTRANKAAMAKDLAGPIMDCLAKTRAGTDQQSPIFKGCWDWHSSVHAHYALFAVNALSGDGAARTRANQNLTPSNITAELRYMKSRVTKNKLDNPYGYAWFLRLAIQHERSTGDKSLRPLANYAANQVAAKLQSNATTVISTGYQNTGWTVLNLAEWAQHTGNNGHKSVAKQVAQRLKGEHCDTARDAGGIGGFMPACLMRLAAVATVDGKSATSWINQQLPQGFSVPVRQNTARGHHNALNFSRAFALARIANVTGNAGLKNNAATLVNWQVQNSRVWKTDFKNNSHWLAQFGVLALQEVVKNGAPANAQPKQDDTPKQPVKPQQPTEPKPKQPEPKQEDNTREGRDQNHDDDFSDAVTKENKDNKPGPGEEDGPDEPEKNAAQSGWERFVAWFKSIFGIKD